VEADQFAALIMIGQRRISAFCADLDFASRLDRVEIFTCLSWQDCQRLKCTGDEKRFRPVHVEVSISFLQGAHGLNSGEQSRTPVAKNKIAHRAELSLVRTLF